MHPTTSGHEVANSNRLIVPDVFILVVFISQLEFVFETRLTFTLIKESYQVIVGFSVIIFLFLFF